MPKLTYAFSSALEDSFPTPTVTCFDNSTLQVSGLVANPGMAYELLFRAAAVGRDAHIACTPSGGNATLTVTNATESWITWVGDTEYDMSAGDAAHNFTFKGTLPHDKLVTLLNAASPLPSSTSPPSTSTFNSLLTSHVSSYRALLGPFSLSLGQQPNFVNSTDELKTAYKTDVGDPYLEWLLFNFGRYLLAGSAPGTLPANLQGKWADGSSNAWSAGEYLRYNEFCLCH